MGFLYNKMTGCRSASTEATMSIVIRIRCRYVTAFDLSTDRQTLTTDSEGAGYTVWTDVM